MLIYTKTSLFYSTKIYIQCCTNSTRLTISNPRFGRLSLQVNCQGKDSPACSQGTKPTKGQGWHHEMVWKKSVLLGKPVSSTFWKLWLKRSSARTATGRWCSALKPRWTNTGLLSKQLAFDASQMFLFLDGWLARSVTEHVALKFNLVAS